MYICGTKAKNMATRNRNGRNLVSSNPNGSKVAYARYLAIKKAELKGIKSKVLDYITQAGSLQAVQLIETKYKLNELI
jgi:hypothetical protein